MGHDDLIHELRTARKNLLAAKALVGFTDKQSQITCLGTMNEAAMAMEEAIAALNTPDRSGTAREGDYAPVDLPPRLRQKRFDRPTARFTDSLR